jgi:ElaB/YqjD/DUF883 family membrane-anchored ribosome-binding protein
MKHHTTETAEAAGQLMDDAKELLSATAGIAEEKVVAARERLRGALQKGGEILDDLKEKAIAGAKATDQTIRENPYQAIGIAVGVGVLVGYLLGRRK